jgi:3-methyladenine DNA glycosylase AlkD
MNEYIRKLRETYASRANAEYALQMKAYMRNQYDFFGLKAEKQRETNRIFLKEAGLPAITDLPLLIHQLWDQPEREMQFFGMLLLDKYKNKVDEDFIQVYEFMISTKSWWDTVDYIAANLVGAHFKHFPHLIPVYTEKWMKSGNLWLQRSALLFQLKYRNSTDTNLMFSLIKQLSGEKDFFIRKAIGWALRQYSKTDPEAVIFFVETHALSGLSQKEAMKVINRKKKASDEF